MLDRVRTSTHDQDDSLLITPEDVKRETAEVFSKQFRKRDHKFDNELPDNWKHEYSPIHEINPEIYNSIMLQPTLNEWLDVVNSSSNKSAAGNSGIGYQMLKHASIDVHNILIILAGLCYRAQVIPTQWKLTSLFLIPKPKDWDYNITNTWPILLIECVRKLTVKILNNRLSAIFTEHNILKGPNYAGLKGCFTSIPIHTVCNIMEDAREKRKSYGLSHKTWPKRLTA